MGYLAEINDILKKNIGVSISPDRLPKESFAKKALDGTLYFPGLFSECVPIGIATTLSRFLERADASFVQTVLSMNSTIDISSDKNASAFLKKFHKNILSFESTEDIYEDESFLQLMKDGQSKITSSLSGKNAAIFEEAENNSLNISGCFKDGLKPVLSDVNTRPLYVLEAGEDDGEINPEYVMDRYIQDRDEARHQALMNNQRDAMLKSKDGNIPKMLNERDAKKLNDFAPYNMSVRLMGVNERNEFVQYLDFVIGIKTSVHILRSDELIANLIRVIENNGFIFKFLKWTTGEKSFIKDLLLNISDIKLDVANKSAGASGWWLTLKRMKETSKLQKKMLSKNQFIPNSSMVITSLEADYIEKNHGYNLNNEKIAKKVMDGLFLMSFIIIDDATKTVKILYDGHPTYEIYSLELLEKEVSVNGNKLGRELSRMISRT